MSLLFVAGVLAPSVALLWFARAPRVPIALAVSSAGAWFVATLLAHAATRSVEPGPYIAFVLLGLPFVVAPLAGALAAIAMRPPAQIVPSIVFAVLGCLVGVMWTRLHDYNVTASLGWCARAVAAPAAYASSAAVAAGVLARRRI